MTPLEMIAAERKRQIEAEGWTPEHDDEHDCGELASAAATYALPDDERDERPLKCTEVHGGGEYCRGHGTIPELWPWHWEWWKPTPKDRERELVKAGALIVAEIERLLRAQSRGAP